jgi:hypothetical protein
MGKPQRHILSGLLRSLVMFDLSQGYESYYISALDSMLRLFGASRSSEA